MYINDKKLFKKRKYTWMDKLKATFPEAEITVDASCCAGTTQEKHKAAMNVMRSCQINVIGEE